MKRSVPYAGASKAAAKEGSSVVYAAPVVIILVLAAEGSDGGAPASSLIERPKLSYPRVHRSQILHTVPENSALA